MLKINSQKKNWNGYNGYGISLKYCITTAYMCVSSFKKNFGRKDER